MLEIIKAQRRRKLFSLMGSADRRKNHVEVIQAFDDIDFIGKTSLSKHYPLKSILYWIAGDLALRNDLNSKISIHLTKNSVRLLDTKEQFMYEYGFKDVYVEKVPNEESTVAFVVAFINADSDCYICKLPNSQMVCVQIKLIPIFVKIHEQTNAICYYETDWRNNINLR